VVVFHSNMKIFYYSCVCGGLYGSQWVDLASRSVSSRCGAPYTQFFHSCNITYYTYFYSYFIVSYWLINLFFFLCIMQLGDRVKQKVTQRAPPSDSDVDGDRASSAAALLALGKTKATLPSPAVQSQSPLLQRPLQYIIPRVRIIKFLSLLHHNKGVDRSTPQQLLSSQNHLMVEIHIMPLAGGKSLKGILTWRTSTTPPVAPY
jgi:hypothetical protein